jgi:hypothetical protein
MLRADHIVRLSYVAMDGKGRVYRILGPLEEYASQVVRYQFKKRYVIIRLRLLGEEKTVALGIILNEDIQREILYGKRRLRCLNIINYRREVKNGLLL